MSSHRWLLWADVLFRLLVLISVWHLVYTLERVASPVVVRVLLPGDP